jgi:hypothetical protein
VSTYDQMKASKCHAADTCRMDAACPFIADCMHAEEPSGVPDAPSGLVCSICMFVRSGEALQAVTVINGHATCEGHATDAQDSPEHWRIIAGIRKKARRDDPAR